MANVRFSILLLLTALTALSTAPFAFAEKQGGTLVFGRGSDSVGLDPANETDGESFRVSENVFDCLVQMKMGSTEIEPALATSWQVSKNGLSYTFELRKGVTFHDGTPFDAKAVQFSFLRQLDPKHPAYAFGGPYIYFQSLGLETLIKSIDAPNPHRVVFRLSRPEAPFLSTLAMQSFAIVSPTAVMKSKKRFRFQPVGTGPFRFVRWEKNQKIVLVANKKYWGGRPYLDRVMIRAIPDNNTRLMEMLSGNIHVMDNPNPDDIDVLRQRMANKIDLPSKAGFNIGYLALNNLKAPFDNRLVRQAVSHAINKKGIIDAIYAGYGQVANNPMPPTLWGHHGEVQEYRYDPKKAKELLTEAGHAAGFKTTLWAMPVPRPYMPNGRKVAESIQADLKAIGIDAKIVSYEWGTYLKKTQNGEHDMALLGWTGDIGDPDNFLYVLLDKSNARKPAQNISFYKSDRLHKVLTAAKQSTSQEEREKLYRQAQEIIAADVPMVPLAHSTVVVPLAKRVKNFVIDPTGQKRFAKVWLD